MMKMMAMVMMFKLAGTVLTPMKIVMEMMNMMMVMINDENNNKEGEIVDENDEPDGGDFNALLEHVYLYLHFFTTIYTN